MAFRIREDFNVDAGLDEAIRLHGNATIADLAAAQAAVEERVRALQSASDELHQLLASLADLSAVTRFTPQGWAERHAELTNTFASDAMAGLSLWVGDCCQAASEVRIGALERLTAGPFPYPSGSQLLIERFVTAQRALAKENWGLAMPVLRAAAAGLRINNQELPTAEVRAALLLLIARIDVALGQDPSADLETAEVAGVQTADTALVRAWAARKENKLDEAAYHLADARSGGSAVAFMAEVVRQARASSVENSLSAASERLAGLAYIADITSQLDRLVEPAPPALWLAIAERAAAEQDSQLAETAFDNAERGTLSDFELGAVIRERRAESVTAARIDPARQAEAWVAAGDYRWWNGQPDAAQAHYRRALDLHSDNVQAAISEVCAEAADCLSKPISESAPDLTRLLAKLETLQKRHGVDNDTAWSLLNVGEVHIQLARTRDGLSANHLWRAILACGRALAIDPKSAPSWTRFAEELEAFGLYQTAFFAAKHAKSLEDAAQESYALINAAIDLGELESASHELMSEQVDDSTPSVKSMKASVRLWQADTAQATGEAIAQLRQAVQEDPSLMASRVLLMRAYLLTGEIDSARREARQLSASIAAPRDLFDLTALARCELICGDPSEAEKYGTQLMQWEVTSVSEGIGLALVGMAKILSSRAEGVGDLITAIGLARNPQALNEWERADLPMLSILADDQGTTLPDLASITNAIARRRDTLAAWADPFVELVEAPTGPADPVIIKRTRGILSVLLREACGDSAGARVALDANWAAADTVPEWPGLAERVLQAYVRDCLESGDLDSALTAEKARLQALDSGSAGRLPEIAQFMSSAGRHDDARRVIDAARDRIGSTPELSRAKGDILWQSGLRKDAEKVWKSAKANGGEGLDARLAACVAAADQPTATALLRAAIAHSYIDTAIDLRTLLKGAADISAVTGALNEAALDPDAAPGAMVAVKLLDGLPEQTELPANGIEVHLPKSWFAGMKDPVVDDPLLARYIPEARLRLSWTLPGVQARDDARLEPDGYRIIVLGSAAEEGNVQPESDYAQAAAVPLLSATVQDRVRDQHLADLVALDRAGEPLAGLDAWLTMSAAEVVGHRIEACAAVFSQALKQFWSHKSET